MKPIVHEPTRNDQVSQTRQAWREVLDRWGLQDFSKKELDKARAKLRPAERSHPEDVEFQAAIDRLESRRDLSSKTIEHAIKEILEAEYECDQAQWERDCHHAAVILHSQVKIPDMKAQHDLHEHQAHEHDHDHAHGHSGKF